MFLATLLQNATATAIWLRSTTLQKKSISNDITVLCHYTLAEYSVAVVACFEARPVMEGSEKYSLEGVLNEVSAVDGVARLTEVLLVTTRV